MPTFLVTGSIAYDMLLTYDGSFTDGIVPEHLDELSVAYVTRHLTRHHGGTAANIAWNLALLGQDVYIAGSVGHDGREYVERLRGRNINVDHVRTFDAHVTSTAIVGTDSAERQITFFHPGADEETRAPDFASLKRKPGHVLVSPHNAVAMEQTARACGEHGIPYVFDPGQQSLQFGHGDLQRVVRGSTVLIANAYEWSLIREALGWRANDTLGYRGLLVVTHGEHGLTLQTPKESIVVGAVPAPKLVNPTGAGDALRAGLVTGLALGWNVRDAARLGAALASFVVECEGPQMAGCSLEKLSERVERTYGEPLPRL